MSPATALILTLCAAEISDADCSSCVALRAFRIRLTPSAASASAQARPSPLLAAQTMAVRPLSPRSMTNVLLLAGPGGFTRAFRVTSVVQIGTVVLLVKPSFTESLRRRQVNEQALLSQSAPGAGSRARRLSEPLGRCDRAFLCVRRARPAGPRRSPQRSAPAGAERPGLDGRALPERDEAPRCLRGDRYDCRDQPGRQQAAREGRAEPLVSDLPVAFPR